jgi:uncharacterized protein YlxW (UPF0749 family)
MDWRQAMTPDGPVSSWRWHYLVPVVLVVAGLLFAASAHTSHGVDLRVTGRDDLSTLVTHEQRTVSGQGHQLTGLERRVQAATAAAARRDAGVAAERSKAQAEAAAAGLTAVSGPAVSVSLDDAPPLPGKQQGSVPPDYLVVHQQDVQAVVNALWAGGATAMTLQGQRVISTSAVRCVGNTLLLQGVVYSPPYVVTAIGNPDSLRDALASAPDIVIYQQYVDAYKLGYAVQAESRVTMPAFSGAVTLQHAKPLTPVASTAAAARLGSGT